MFNLHTEARGKGMARLVAKLLAVAAIALGATAAHAGIANTKHSLGADNAANENYMTTGTTEICVFCHTPHASNTNVQAPLWNKPVAAGSSYTTYTTATSATIDGYTITVRGSSDLASFPVTVTPVDAVTGGLPAAPVQGGITYEYRSFSLGGSNGTTGKGFLQVTVTHP